MKTKQNVELNIEHLAEYSEKLAVAGGACAKRWFRMDVSITLKNDKSPVTEADRNTEAMLRESIIATFPDHGLLGEEYGQDNTQFEYVWSIDPIDGTRSFITGSPLWGTLLALLRHGRPIVGAVELPILEERWLAYKGGGCWFTDKSGNKRKSKVSACRRLDEAKFYTTSPLYFDEAEKPAMMNLIQSVREPRFGGDCYIYCLLAAGFIDLVAESQLHPFDYLPLINVVEESGGIITDWQGKPLNMKSPGQVVAAATSELHEQALSILNKDR